MDLNKYKNFFLLNKNEKSIKILLILFLVIWGVTSVIFIGFCRYYGINGDANSTSAYINLLVFNGTIFAPLTVLFLYNNWKKQAVYNDVLNGVAKVRVDIEKIYPEFNKIIEEYGNETYFEIRDTSELAQLVNQVYKEWADYDETGRTKYYGIIEKPISDDKYKRLDIFENKINKIKQLLIDIYIKYEELCLKCEIKEKINPSILSEIFRLFDRMYNEYDVKLEQSLYDHYRWESHRKRYGKSTDWDNYSKNIFSPMSREAEKIKVQFKDCLEKLRSEFNIFPNNF